MKIFPGKIWLFAVFAFFILLAVFYFKNLNVKITEILSQSNLFGASLTKIGETPINEIVLPENEEQNQQRAEELAVSEQSSAKNAQEQLDDIAEKIDILKQEILKLEAESQPNINKEPEIVETVALKHEAKLALSGRENIDDNKDIAPADIAKSEPPKINFSVGRVGGPGKKSYLKIIISEVEIAGQDDKKQEFVELYNPNSTDVDLTDWYLQKKTKNGENYSTFASNKLFSEKKITANGYFLIARQGFFADAADIFTDGSLSEDSSLILKNPNREITDKVGWGQPQDFEGVSFQNPQKGQSFGRKFDETSQNYFDTDNNSADFELNEPTPKLKNIKWTEPPVPVVEEKDTTAPEVSFNIEAVQNSLNFSINFTITDPTDAVTASGIDSYIFRQKEEAGDWQEDILTKVSGYPMSANLIREFLGEDGKTYYFQVKAKDIEGNESIWLPEIPVEIKIEIIKPVEIKPVVINEIQIEGETVEDDWVELYNPNNFDVDISQWSIQRSSKTGNIYKKNFKPGSKIAANGYFLIVRDEASQELLDIADMDCSALQLSQDSTIYLVKNREKISNENDEANENNEDIIDKVGFSGSHGYETSPAPVPEKNQSIKRKILGQDTNDNSQDFIISDKPTPKAD